MKHDEELLNQIAVEAKSMFNSNKELTFLLIGRTGVGKSSIINSLVGKEVAPTDKYQPMTMEVSTYKHDHNGFTYKIIDTPGLCDDLPEVDNDKKYLEKIIESKISADCVWFVTELDAARVTSDEKRGIKLITEALGADLWSKSIIVFTRADKSTDFSNDLSHRTRLLRSEIGKYYSRSNNIPGIAVSNTNPLLPDGKSWLGELFTQIFLRLDDKGALPFLQSMSPDIGAEPTKIKPKEEGDAQKEKTTNEQHRAAVTGNQQNKPRIELNEEQKEKIKDSAWKRIVSGASAGAAIGERIGKDMALKVAWLEPRLVP